ncbi:MAG: hypothetical protein A3G20_03805 [Acidobacteria bacterium RIFCSPLOWO2_12_FULL_59_11]|nr:MAG: hypothetical protein A3G20_03805 [Acidobacteria bacterium RIFCSPLOWO2_12_FULL_59_11]
MAPKEVAAKNAARTTQPFVPLIAAWLVPGGGHLYQRRWGRGALLCGSVSALFLAGLTMQGRFFEPASSNMVEMLGFLGNFCSGLLFLGAKQMGYNAVASASPIADFGTKFLLVAGLLNVLCILDAYDIAMGKKD